MRNAMPRRGLYLVTRDSSDTAALRATVRAALEGGAPLAAPYFHARRGHPVGISARFRQELLSLGGDEGAKAVVSRHSADLLKIPVGDPGVIRDIDRPEDLAPPLRV